MSSPSACSPQRTQRRHRADAVEERYGDDFDALRTGFTAAVSHELRTPLARILVLLDSADLPGADVHALVDQARAEVEHAGALIDEILFLWELESGREVVALGSTAALPVLEDVAAGAGRRRRHEPASRSAPTATRRSTSRCDRGCSGSSPRTSPRTRSATPATGRASRCRCSARTAPPSSPEPTTASASPPATCLGSSSASTAPTARAPRAAPVSASRSSSTSSRPRAERSRPAASGAAGLEIRCVFPLER